MLRAVNGRKSVMFFQKEFSAVLGFLLVESVSGSRVLKNYLLKIFLFLHVISEYSLCALKTDSVIILLEKNGLGQAFLAIIRTLDFLALLLVMFLSCILSNLMRNVILKLEITKYMSG